MKTRLLFVTTLLLFCTVQSFAQVISSIDSPSCNNPSSVTINSTLTGYIPTATNLDVDDGFTCFSVPIGFTFSFYGVNYTRCLVGGNGTIDFTIADSCDYEAWDLSDPGGSTTTPYPLPANTNCRNQIMGCYSDIYTPAGGTVTYATVGTAPNRLFVVTFCEVPMYSPGICSADDITFQMILHETSNLIDVMITHKQVCTAWNNGWAIQGVENATGTAFTAFPGRNDAVWTAEHDGARFSPTSPTVTTAYTASAIPYAPIPYATSNIYWYADNVLVDSGNTVVFSPTVTTTYIAEAYGCNDTTSDTITLISITEFDSLLSIATIGSRSVVPTYCGDTDGTVTITGLPPHQADSIFCSINGIPQPPFVDSSASDSTLTFTGLSANVGGVTPTIYTYYYKHGNCASNTVSDTMINLPVVSSFTDVVNLGCNGDTVSFTNNSTPAGFTYVWTYGDGSFPNSTVVNPIHVYPDRTTGIGTYTVILNYQTDTIAACISIDTEIISFYHPIHASFTVDKDTICLGTTSIFTNASIGNDPGYLWSYGDGNSDTISNPVHTFVAGGIYDVILTVTDTIKCTSKDTLSLDVIALSVTTGVHDTSVCLPDSMSLHAYTTLLGKPDSVNYRWTPQTGLGEPDDSVTKFFGLGHYTFLVTTTAYPTICIASDTEEVMSYPPITITNLTATQTIAYGSSIQLNADGALYYRWTPDDGSLNDNNINDPIATPIDSVTTYTVYGMNAYGCLDSASLIIKQGFTDPEIVPSAFSPNNDGRNDVFRIPNLQYGKLVDFRVFNRWGQQMFQTANAEMGWDGTFNGTPQDMGTYNYFVIIEHADGTQKTYTGTVTLIR